MRASRGPFTTWRTIHRTMSEPLTFSSSPAGTPESESESARSAVPSTRRPCGRRRSSGIHLQARGHSVAAPVKARLRFARERLLSCWKPRVETREPCAKALWRTCAPTHPFTVYLPVHRASDVRASFGLSASFATRSCDLPGRKRTNASNRRLPFHRTACTRTS